MLTAKGFLPRFRVPCSRPILRRRRGSPELAECAGAAFIERNPWEKQFLTTRSEETTAHPTTRLSSSFICRCRSRNRISRRCRGDSKPPTLIRLNPTLQQSIHSTPSFWLSGPTAFGEERKRHSCLSTWFPPSPILGTGRNTRRCRSLV